MNRLLVTLALLYIAGPVYGLGVNFGDHGHSKPKPHGSKPHKVAIIGAGAGGSSASFWLGKAKERSGLDIEIDVYEKSSYIGGRSTVVYPFGDTSLPSMELGASIIVPANLNLMRAKAVYNLTFSATDSALQDLRIWDGEKSILWLKGDSTDSATLFAEYGIDTFIKRNAIIQTLVAQYLTLYQSGSWENITSLVKSVPGWEQLTQESATTSWTRQGVPTKYIYGLLEAILQVNYAQGPDQIHGLEGFLGVATDGFTGIAGGFGQIFERFLRDSGAKVRLNTAVTSILPSQAHGSSKWSVATSKGVTTSYDEVIIAAPFHQTGIKTTSSVAGRVPPQPYVHLHVTLLTTTAFRPNPEYFNLPPGSNATHRTYKTSGAPGGKKPESTSLTYLNVVRPGEYAVKLFSLKKVSDKLLHKLFGNTVTWVYRKEWEAYPYLPPTTKFPPIKLEKGLYYVNAFEPLLSTMETETVASRNVVELLLREEFDTGICPLPVSTPTGPNFAYGWDC